MGYPKSKFGYILKLFLFINNWIKALPCK